MRQLMLLIVATATLVACNTNTEGTDTTADVGALDAGTLDDTSAPVLCGDGVCTDGETTDTCPMDCGDGSTEPTDPGPGEGNLPPADCSGCLQGAADCLTQCQNDGFSDGYCGAPGSLNPEICCLCNNPSDPPTPLSDCGDGDCNGDENSDNCAADCDAGCKPPHYKMVNGECLSSCGALINASGWDEGTCCKNGCADASQNVNVTWDCPTCCPGIDSCVDSKPSPPPTIPANYTESDCLVSPTNDNEVCDDEGFTVGSNTDLALVCMGNQGGKVYIASNTGPVMFDGIPRCQGWENNGQNAWDHLDYIAAIVCDGTQSVLEVDLSNWAGQKVYVGVHDHPNAGVGHNTMACIVNSKNPGSGGIVTPPPPTGADPEPDPPSTEGCELGGLYNGAIKASVLATAKYVKKKHPEFFDIEDWDNLAKRKQAYKMMTVVLNHLRAKCVNASRCVANPGHPQSNPFHWCSDALVIGPPGQGTTVDVYGSWSSPATPQAHVTEDGGETGVVTADLVPLP